MFRLYLLNELSTFEYTVLFIFLFFIASYVLLFAFTIMLLWQTYLSAKNIVIQESGSLAKIVFNSNTFTPTEEDAVHRAVQNYIKIVVYKEWALMNKGTSSEEARLAFINIGTTLATFKKDQDGNIFYQDAVNDFSKAFEARRARIALLGSIIPNSLYCMILCILLITLTALNLQKRSTNSHVILLFFASSIFGLSFAVLTSFDFPFAGQIAISPEPFTRGMLTSLYNSIDKPQIQAPF